MVNLKKYLNDKVFVQLGHGAGGYGLMITPVALAHSTWKPLLIGLAIVLGWTIFKEFIFDPIVEYKAIQGGWKVWKLAWKDGLVDARSYFIGAGLAFVVVLLGKAF